MAQVAGVPGGSRWLAIAFVVFRHPARPVYTAGMKHSLRSLVWFGAFLCVRLGGLAALRVGVAMKPVAPWRRRAPGRRRRARARVCSCIATLSCAASCSLGIGTISWRSCADTYLRGGAAGDTPSIGRWRTSRHRINRISRAAKALRRLTLVHRTASRAS